MTSQVHIRTWNENMLAFTEQYGDPLYADEPNKDGNYDALWAYRDVSFVKYTLRGIGGDVLHYLNVVPIESREGQVYWVTHLQRERENDGMPERELELLQAELESDVNRMETALGRSQDYVDGLFEQRYYRNKYEIERVYAQTGSITTIAEIQIETDAGMFQSVISDELMSVLTQKYGDPDYVNTDNRETWYWQLDDGQTVVTFRPFIRGIMVAEASWITAASEDWQQSVSLLRAAGKWQEPRTQREIPSEVVDAIAGLRSEVARDLAVIADLPWDTDISPADLSFPGTAEYRMSLNHPTYHRSEYYVALEVYSLTSVAIASTNEDTKPWLLEILRELLVGTYGDPAEKEKWNANDIDWEVWRWVSNDGNHVVSFNIVNGQVSFAHRQADRAGYVFPNHQQY